MVPADPWPHIAHVPYLLSEDGGAAELHLAHNNPIVAAAAQAPLRAMLIVMGPDGYVSPDWYGDPSQSQVPTWNYVAIHATGMLHAVDPDTLSDHLDRLSAFFEGRLSPKRPWTTDKMPKAKHRAMMRAIRPFRFEIEATDGTWKLNQNKSEPHRQGAAEHIKNSPLGHETAELSALILGIGPRVREE